MYLLKNKTKQKSRKHQAIKHKSRKSNALGNSMFLQKPDTSVGQHGSTV
jgi:hypothetical protein